jgi:hypothetical protein
MRLIIMPLSILRQSVAALQLSAIWRGTSVFDNPVSQDLANQDIAISVRMIDFHPTCDEKTSSQESFDPSTDLLSP